LTFETAIRRGEQFDKFFVFGIHADDGLRELLKGQALALHIGKLCIALRIRIGFQVLDITFGTDFMCA